MAAAGKDSEAGSLRKQYPFDFDLIHSEWDNAKKAAERGRHKASLAQALKPLASAVLTAGCSLFAIQSYFGGANDSMKHLLCGASVLLSFGYFLRPYSIPSDLSTAECATSYPVRSDGKRPANGQQSDSSVDQGAPKGEGWPRRNALVKQLVDAPGEGLKNIYDIFYESSQKHSQHPCLGSRQVKNARVQTIKNRDWVKTELGGYNWLSYSEVLQNIQKTMSGLRGIGIQPGERIGLYATTCADWMTMALSCFRLGNPVATIYTSLGLDALAYAIEQTKMTTLLIDESLLPTLVKIMNGHTLENAGDNGEDIHVKMNNLKRIITIQDLQVYEPSKKESAKEARTKLSERDTTHGGPINFYAMQDLLKGDYASASFNLKEEKEPTRNDEALIMYTSGSTGIPKGVIITHGNLMAAVGGMVAAVPNIGPSDVYIGYLPLAHVLELVAELCLLHSGCAIGYAHPFTLVNTAPMVDRERGSHGDAIELRPTLMAAVPAIMDRVRNGITQKVESRGIIAKTLFRVAYFYKYRAVQNGTTSPFWDWLLLDRIRTEALGGRMRVMLSGGGPLGAQTQKFMNVVFSCPVGQGYGLTETCGGATIVWANERLTGRTGPPVLCTDVKLVDWKDGGYTSRDKPRPRGEICLSGPNIVQGYLDMPEKTEEGFRRHDDGRIWFHTGDIGTWDADGVLRIIDRKKDLIKLNRGEYIALGRIESTLKHCNWVDNVCLYANSEKNSAVAVIVPMIDLVHKELNVEGDYASIAKNEQVVKKIESAIKDHAKKSKLERYEIPSKIILAEEQWTPENEFVTAALKLRREKVYSKYRDSLEALYDE